MRFRKALALAAGILTIGAGAPALAGLPAHDAATTTSARVDEVLASQLDAAAPADRLLVFVHATNMAAARAAADAAGLTTVDTFDRVAIAVATGTPAQIDAAARQPGVTYLEGDEPITFDLDTSHVATRGAEARTAFQSATVTETTTTVGNKNNGKGNKRRTTTTTSTAFEDEIDGTGIGIAVIDSGVDGTHPMFQVDTDGDGTADASKVVRNLKHACPSGVLLSLAGPCVTDPASVEDPITGEPYGDAHDEAFVDLTGLGNDTDTPSNGGHGTHVASIAGGVDVTTTDGRELHGAAPDASIVSLSVGQTISVYGGAAGLNWVLEHHEAPCGEAVPAAACPAIRVANNSWGYGGDYDPDDAISKIQDALVDDGVVVVWAAGNSGGDGSADRVNPPAKSPTPGILSVANYDDGDTGTRDGALDGTSSRGKRGEVATYPDISAPGTGITAACRIYLPICGTGFDFIDGGDYNTITGTSMAAPHIAGIVAQLLEVDPTLTPAEIEDVLEDTAYQFAGGGAYEPDLAARNADHTTSFDKGHGLVDVVAALEEILGATVPTSGGGGGTCLASDPVVVDPEGDASDVLGSPTPLPSASGLDVLTGDVSWDGTDATFTINVSDLTETPPEGTAGEYFDFNFSYGGAGYYLGAEWSRVEGQFFTLGRIVTTREKLADLTGSFDVDTDTITIVLPGDAIAGAVDGAPVMADGDVLTGFSIVARRQMGVLVPDADTAEGTGCPYTLGSEPTA